MSDIAAFQTGLFDAGLVTSATVTLSGATGEAEALVSQPIGLFIDGLGAIEPNGLLIDTSGMVGETNTSIIVGDPIESPNLPTAIGAPMAVFFAAAFQNNFQVTVISEAIAARLELNTANPDFEVEIIDVTGAVTTAPGFYIDSLEITATPEWLSFTNVPVVMLDIESPEGGLLDGIIGMNLFVDLNFVFHGGGLTLLGQDQPFIKYDFICRITGGIAPEIPDCMVNLLDLAEIAKHWLENEASPNWNPKCDMAPQPAPDGKVDFLDFAVLAEHWSEGI